MQHDNRIIQAIGRIPLLRYRRAAIRCRLGVTEPARNEVQQHSAGYECLYAGLCGDHHLEASGIH
jgi:hypothetical protein